MITQNVWRRANVVKVGSVLIRYILSGLNNLRNKAIRERRPSHQNPKLKSGKKMLTEQK